MATNISKSLERDREFLDDYWDRYYKILFESRDDSHLIKLRDCCIATNNNGGKLIFVGNGASASLASHAATDFTKQAKVRATAFNDHNLVTAFANDYGYDHWVARALECYARPKDMVVFISVSGKSPNLVNGLRFANKKDIKCASLTGADPKNALRQGTDPSLWVNSKAYNIVESIHTIWITLVIDMIIGSPEYSV